MQNVTVMDHPLIQHKLSILRDEATTVRDFRSLCTEITMLMAFEAMRELPLE
jgi:uracil phosphoribosyltransferase